MKKIVVPVVALAALLALAALAGCGSGPSDIKVVDSGYSVEDEHVTYVAVLENPNSDRYTNYAHVAFSGLDKDGNEVFSSEEIITVNADTTTAVAGYDTLEGTIESMEVTVTVQDDQWVEGALEGNCEITDIEEKPDSIGYYDYSYTLHSTYSQDSVSSLQVTVVLYDKDGNIVGGDYTFDTNYEGQDYQSTLPALYTPEHDHYEFYVLPVAY